MRLLGKNMVFGGVPCEIGGGQSFKPDKTLHKDNNQTSLLANTVTHLTRKLAKSRFSILQNLTHLTKTHFTHVMSTRKGSVSLISRKRPNLLRTTSPTPSSIHLPKKLL
jgi:hypothetical protein